MNGAATPDTSFLRPTKVPYKVLYALLFTLLVVMIVLLLPNKRSTELVAISAVERMDRENTGSSGTDTSIVFRDDSAQVVFNATYPMTRPQRKGTAHFWFWVLYHRPRSFYQLVSVVGKCALLSCGQGGFYSGWGLQNYVQPRFKLSVVKV